METMQRVLSLQELDTDEAGNDILACDSNVSIHCSACSYAGCSSVIDD